MSPPIFHRHLWLASFVWLAGILGAGAGNDFQGDSHLVPLDGETINYYKTSACNAVSRLQARLSDGKTVFKAGTNGYLPAVLKELGIPASSQVLVFSKTSFQRDLISPARPRALYFNDDTYLGFIPGAPLLEISVADPKLGAVFYTLEQSAPSRPKLVREDQCLECHATSRSMGVPGHILRSLQTDLAGQPDLNTGAPEVNHRTPLAERWGGWYVTGELGSQTHRGNLIGAEAFARQAKMPGYLGNRTNLQGSFETGRYPEPGSDVVALLVLEHQAHLHNFMARLHYEAAARLATYGHINYVTNMANAFLKCLLFTEEAPLTHEVRGTSAFTREFEQRGPFDRQGRSLRKFDLHTRMFRYPCSYLIYSEAFDALPSPLRAYLYQRLYDILTGRDTSPEFAGLTAQKRQEIMEILRETKTDLPDYWRKQTEPRK